MSHLRVLLVEDNAVNQRVARQMLKLLGVVPDIAGNGVEAVESFERQAYDIVLMDMQMPELDGIEATARIRAIEAARGAPRTPIVALTAGAMKADQERCLSAGMDGYVSKPFKFGDLVRVLRAVADARGAASATAR